MNVTHARQLCTLSIIFLIISGNSIARPAASAAVNTKSAKPNSKKNKKKNKKKFLGFHVPKGSPQWADEGAESPEQEVSALSQNQETGLEGPVAESPNVIAKSKVSKNKMPPAGSNYVMSDLGNFTGSNNKAWDNLLRPIIGTYHLNPELVEQQLRAIYQSGQRLISLMLWYTKMDPSVDVAAHVVNSTGGSLHAQQQENLRKVLALIRDIGFTEIQFRFAQQGNTNPRDWHKWNQKIYKENWQFILSTRTIVEQTLAGSPVKRIYDLGVELGGAAGFAGRYVKTMWQSYVKLYGKNDSYGFSVGYSRLGRFGDLMKVYDSTSVGPPKIYAVDLYGNVYKKLQTIAGVMKSRNELGKGIIIQEVYFNNKGVRNQILKARSDFNLNILCVMQWPKINAKTDRLNTVNYQQISAYQ